MYLTVTTGTCAVIGQINGHILLYSPLHLKVVFCTFVARKSLKVTFTLNCVLVKVLMTAISY